MQNKVDLENSIEVLFFSTMLSRLVKQKFELVYNSLEIAWDVLNLLLSVSFKGCWRSVQNMNLLLNRDVRKVCVRLDQLF